MIETMSPASITVTATARRIEPERLAKLEREHLRVMDGGEHRSAKEEASENKYVRVIGRNDMEQLQRHKSAS
jgi:hypothetical protein